MGHGSSTLSRVSTVRANREGVLLFPFHFHMSVGHSKQNTHFFLIDIRSQLIKQ